MPSGDRSAFLGSLALGTPVDLGSTLYVVVNNIQKQIYYPYGGTLYAYLVTAAAYTPASATVHKITLHTIRVGAG